MAHLNRGGNITVGPLVPAAVDGNTVVFPDNQVFENERKI